MGINIIANQRMGSASRSCVLEARAYMSGILILQFDCVRRNQRCAERERANVQRPDDEADQGDERKAALGYLATAFAALHAEHALAEFYPNHDDLHGGEEVANVLNGRGEPGIEVAPFVTVVEEELVERGCEADDGTDDGAEKRCICELPCHVHGLLGLWAKVVEPVLRLEIAFLFETVGRLYNALR